MWPYTMEKSTPSSARSDGRVRQAPGCRRRLDRHDDRSRAGDVGVIDHGDQHRRHRGDEPGALAVDQFEAEPGSNIGSSTGVSVTVEGAEDPDHAAGGVEQRHRRHPHRSVRESDPVRPQHRVVDDALVTQHGTLREPRRAAGVLDLHWIVGVHRGKHDRLVDRRIRHEVVELVEAKDVTQLLQVGPDHLGVRRQRVAPHVRHQEHAGGPRLAEHVGGLGRLEARVDGDQRDPGEAGAVLEHDPFRQVVRPHADTLPRLEPGQQHARAPLGRDQQLGVRPAAPAFAGYALHQGHASGTAAATSRNRDPMTASRSKAGPPPSGIQWDVDSLLVMPLILAGQPARAHLGAFVLGC